MNSISARRLMIIACVVIPHFSALAFQNSDQKVFDWPRFRGPEGNGISQESSLLKTWPADGPQQLWRMPLGIGYSGMSVQNNRLYTMDSDSSAESVLCLNASSGELLWRQNIGPQYKNSYGDGPRATPTLEGDRLYALGAQGKLLAANSETGELIWQVDLTERFTFKPPQYWWGFSGSPFIDGDLLLVQAGGDGENTIAAFNKNTGALVWSRVAGFAAYTTPIAIDMHGKRQYIFVTAHDVISLSADGNINWRYDWGGWFIKIAMPVFVPPDKIFVSAAYDIGAVLLQIGAQGDSVSVREVWKSRVMSNHFHSSVLLGDYLYGFDNGTLKCIEVETGTEKWGKRRLGKGSLIYADGMLIVLGERGQLVLVEANPQQYVELARHQALSGRSWTPPTLADGKLYLRNQTELLCLKMK